MSEKEYLLTEKQIYEYIQMLHGAAADEHAASCEYVTIYDLHEWLKAHEYRERTCMLASTQLTHHAPMGNTFHTYRIV